MRGTSVPDYQIYNDIKIQNELKNMKKHGSDSSFSMIELLKKRSKITKTKGRGRV
jgi:hypothetical protein